MDECVFCMHDSAVTDNAGYSIGKIVSKIVITTYGSDGYLTYRGGHFVSYISI